MQQTKKNQKNKTKQKQHGWNAVHRWTSSAHFERHHTEFHGVGTDGLHLCWVTSLGLFFFLFLFFFNPTLPQNNNTKADRGWFGGMG